MVTVTESIWDTFLKGYCEGIVALARKNRGIDDDFTKLVTRAAIMASNSRSRLRYAHQIRNDAAAEDGGDFVLKVKQTL